MTPDDRRLLLAFVLSLLVFLVYQHYMDIMYPHRPPVLSSQISDTSASGSGTGPRSPAHSVSPAFASVADRPADTEELTVLQGNGFELTATSRGAGLKQIRLYGIPRRPRSDMRDVILVDEDAASSQVAIRIPGYLHPPNFKKIQSSSSRLVYVFEDGQERVERSFELTNEKYEVRLLTKIQNMSAKTIQNSSDTAMTVDLAPFPKKPNGGSSLDVHELFVKLGEDVQHRQENAPGFFESLFGRRKKSTEERRETFTGQLHWISLGDRYFTITLIPSSPLAGAGLVMKGPEISASAHYGAFELAPGASANFEEHLYAGPKSPDRLSRFGKDLLEIMNFGWFGWLGFWMLWLLNQFHRLIPNYGVAIIFMTGLVRLVLYPLTYKSYVSMAKLKELGPKMKAVQEKYASNKEKLNKELMRLYKDNKVNPAGGCLPILLQIPVFIAFYRMLQYAIELRGAPFCLWIQDLSEKDPYYVLPVLMGISMLIQQKMTPSPDPNQAKIGMMMTVMFTFLFLMFPSGLVLYWLVSNLLGIWQQKIIEKKMKAIPPAPA